MASTPPTLTAICTITVIAEVVMEVALLSS
jgi:hypothetical protein